MPTYNQLFHTHSLNIQHWLAFPKKLNVSKKELKFLFHYFTKILSCLMLILFYLLIKKTFIYF